ncbi:Peptidase M50 [Tepidanaerobacter acetatoxydans Re1]|uniref:Peptidase M50 n=1 Tax=Tepidanaerobacter acetatoxydans (strain DSM 21804 / JCM 16047 / Re1) TaxID=1209989 RepID=F4LW06_TEPAE|nr:site-2 protease family protein [Tepidanaerobacter acetatoxydans]AEE91674.1 peptidase M50 [Tepidanaerobacter acetatoxydans Re1]CDI40768.1 Peptidase M50 [Tepidanaerobacter acetatoxydans Re1]
MNLRVSNLRISISFFFIIIVVLAVLAGLYTEVLAALLALGIHEYAHIFVGCRLGIVIHEIEILPFGGRIRSSLDEATLEKEMLMVMAGPLANFTMAGLILFLLTQAFITPNTARQFIHYQLMLGMFNMLPALPLDGGRIFALWLRQRFAFTLSIRIASRAGKILAYSMLILALIGLAFKRLFLSFFVAGIFLLQQTSKEEKNAHFIFMKHLAGKKEKISKNKYMPGEIMVVNEDTPAKKILYSFAPQKYFVVYVLDENMKIKKSLTETEIFDKVVEKGLDLMMKDLI